MSNFAKGQLKSIIERVERLEEEKKGLGADVREVMAEAKGHGFNTKIIRKVLAIRAMEPAQRQEQEDLVDLYLSALEPAATGGNVVPMQQVAAAAE